MVPIGPLFERFRRVVRDLSLGSGKEVTLELRGESTELDKRMIDELSDPLIHMVRNAVDHGLEPPEDRREAGKPAAGTVTLAARAPGQPGRHHRSATTAGGWTSSGSGARSWPRALLTEAEAARLDPGEVIPYIFHPGLSTAEAVTDISGRGVGMDIVKDRVEQLNGSVAVRTEPGRGTTFTIRLPLTLAIMPSLLVRIFDEVYAIPLGEIREIVEVELRTGARRGRDTGHRGPRPDHLAGRGSDDVFRWGGGRAPDRDQGQEPAGVRRPVVVVQSSLATVGLVVDELIGIQEIVLKSIEKNYRAVRGLSGASILGDGRVSLILDVDALIELATTGSAGAVGRPRRPWPSVRGRDGRGDERRRPPLRCGPPSNRGRSGPRGRGGLRLPSRDGSAARPGSPSAASAWPVWPRRPRRSGRATAWSPPAACRWRGRCPAWPCWSSRTASALEMIDALLGRPAGRPKEWGELERSAAQETTNIVSGSFVNALADALSPGDPLDPGPSGIPPGVRGEPAAIRLARPGDPEPTGSCWSRTASQWADDDTGWTSLLVPTAGGSGDPRDRPGEVPGDGP